MLGNRSLSAGGRGFSTVYYSSRSGRGTTRTCSVLPSKGEKKKKLKKTKKNSQPWDDGPKKRLVHVRANRRLHHRSIQPVARRPHLPHPDTASSPCPNIPVPPRQKSMDSRTISGLQTDNSRINHPCNPPRAAANPPVTPKPKKGHRPWKPPDTANRRRSIPCRRWGPGSPGPWVRAALAPLTDSSRRFSLRPPRLCPCVMVAGVSGTAPRAPGVRRAFCSRDFAHLFVGVGWS